MTPVSLLFRGGCAFALGFLSLATTGHAADSAAAAPKKKIRIVLVGDSTTAERTGWGPGFQQFINEDVAECINVARGGRSSKSFIGENLWQPALDLKGDYYLFQFGHNDEPGKGPDRETDPATTFSQNMARYVDETRAIGAKPILITSLTRRKFEDTDKHKLTPSLVPYADATAKVAADKHVPLLDLHARSIELCEQLGEDGCAPISARKADGGVDQTHLNAKGSIVIARLVIAELRKNVPELASAFLAEPRPMPPEIARGLDAPAPPKPPKTPAAN